MPDLRALAFNQKTKGISVNREQRRYQQRELKEIYTRIEKLKKLGLYPYPAQKKTLMQKIKGFFKR